MNRLLSAAACAALVAACAGPQTTTAPSPSTATTATTAGAPAASALAATTVAVTEMDFKIVPAATTVPSNVVFNVHSTGPTPHNFNLRDEMGKVVLSSHDLRAGESETVAGQLAPGTYTFFCAFPGHESLGMHGTLTVTS